MILQIISLIAILIMITVTIVNIILTINLRNQIKDDNTLKNNTISNIQKDIQMTKEDIIYFKKNLRAYLENRIEFSTRTYLDRAEFSNLDIRAKEVYKKYIADMIMPAIIEKVNIEVKSPNFSQYDDFISSMITQSMSELQK